jgi:O-antigen ligase
MGRDPEIEDYYFGELGDAPQRVKQHGYEALIVTYRQSGFFGEGVGTATQGAHHLKVKRPRTWQEGGLSRILVELGVPGFICFLMLAIALVWRVLSLITKHLEPKSKEFPIMAGLGGVLFANACSFVVSYQIFGDPFIIVFFSLLVGFLLSIGRETVMDDQKRSGVGGLESEV